MTLGEKSLLFQALGFLLWDHGDYIVSFIMWGVGALGLIELFIVEYSKSRVK